MKNGLFKTLAALSLGLFFLQMSGCAALELGSEDDADYDRGYQAEDRVDNGCRGPACNAEAEESDAPARGLASLSEEEFNPDQRVKRAIETRDVILGMTRQDVMDSWGEPSQREVAGRGSNGHERWTYGSRYSLENSRTVIFENGRVAGWHR